MPTLPTAADILGKVTPTSQAPVKISAGAFPDYSGAYEIGSKLMNIGSALKDRDDTTEAQDLSNKLNAARRRLLDGDKDTPGYSSLSGRNARDERERIEAEFERERKSLEGAASNDNVRKKISGVFATQGNSFLDSVANHVRAQDKIYEDQVGENTMTELNENFTRDPSHANKLLIALEARRQASRKYGADPEVAKSASAEAVSNAHLSALDVMTISDPSGARAYFEKNKDEITAKEWDKLIPAIKANEQKGLGDADRREMAGKHDLTTAAGKAAANAELDARYKGRPEQLAVSKAAVDAAATRAEKLKKEAETETIQSVRQKLYANPDAALTVAEQDVVNRTKGEAAWIRKVRKIGGRPVVSDNVSNKNLAEFQDEYERWFKNPGETPSASAFKVAWDTKLNPTHYDEARKKVDALRAHHRGDQVDAGETTVMTNGQRIKNALIQVGMHDILEKSSQRSDESKIAQAQFTTGIEKLLRAEAKKLKRELYPDEAENIIDRAAANLVWVNSVLGSGDPRYPVISLTKEIIDGDDIYVPLEKLSAGRKKTLRNTLRQSGIYASDSNVEELAGAARMGMDHVVRWLRENAPSSPRPPTSPTINTQPLPNAQGN